MTRQLFDEVSGSPQLDVTTIFSALPLDYRRSLVLRALRARDQVSLEAGRNLDSAIRGSIRLIGYSDPALAISSTLVEPVNTAIVNSAKLATATLKVWAESLDGLEEMVTRHLSSQNLPTEYPDLENGKFRGFWDSTAWQRQYDWVVDIAERWEEDDVALMLCYVSGRTVSEDDLEPLEDEPEEDAAPEAASIQAEEPAEVPVAQLEDQPEYGNVTEAEPEDTPEEAEPLAVPVPPAYDPMQPGYVPPAAGVAPEPSSEIASDTVLNQCLDYISSLYPEDRKWDNAIPAFAEAVNSLRSLKRAQKERRGRLKAANQAIAQEFSTDLEFLEQDTSFWATQSLTELSDLDRALELTSGLRELLVEYRDVRRPGATLSEELVRRERRFALEPRILDSISLLRNAMTGGRDRSDS